VSEVVRAQSHEAARDEAIRAFLRGRPEFIRSDAALMLELGLRPDAANVVDFGPAALSRVARAHKRETNVRRRLEAVAQANFDAQAQTHDAALHLMGAQDHADLAGRLDDIARGFGLAAAVIALEGPEAVPTSWRAMAPGQCDLALGDKQPARLGRVPTARGLFDPETEVESVALLRLALWSPARTGMLAFGAPTDDVFDADMGHELIDFLARVVERTAERWPAG
jgi:uncharacterized protein YigA (DUF484 family)